jgi:hypothetical protein
LPYFESIAVKMSACGQASAVRHIHIFPGKSRVRVVSPGNDARIVRDSTGVLAEWKATEARVQCLADRADAPWSNMFASLLFVCLVVFFGVPSWTRVIVAPHCQLGIS